MSTFLDRASQRLFDERKTALLAEMNAGRRSKTSVVATLRKLAARLFPRREPRVRQAARMLLRRVVPAEAVPESERAEFLAIHRVVEDIAAGGNGEPESLEKEKHERRIV